MTRAEWVTVNSLWKIQFFETLKRLVGKWSICASMTYGFVFNTTSNAYRKDFTLDSAYTLFCRQSLRFYFWTKYAHIPIGLVHLVIFISVIFFSLELIVRWTKMKSLKPRIDVGWSLLPPWKNAFLHADLEWWWCLCSNGSGNCHSTKFYCWNWYHFSSFSMLYYFILCI